MRAVSPRFSLPSESKRILRWRSSPICARAAGNLENLVRLFPSLLPHAARQVDSQHNVQRIGRLEDFRIDQSRDERGERARSKHNGIKRNSASKGEKKLGRQQDKHSDYQHGPERKSRLCGGHTPGIPVAGFSAGHIQARSDEGFTLIEKIDGEATRSAGALVAVEPRLQRIGEDERTGDRFQPLYLTRRGRYLYLAVACRQAK